MQLDRHIAEMWFRIQFFLLVGHGDTDVVKLYKTSHVYTLLWLQYIQLSTYEFETQQYVDDEIQIGWGR